MTGEGTATTARLQAEKEAQDVEARMKKLDADMSKISITIAELEGQLQALEARLGASDLPPEQRAEVERELEALGSDLSAARAELGRLQSEYAELQSKASTLRDAAEASGNEALNAGYDTLHKELAAYRKHVRTSDKNAITGRFDSLWTRLDAIQSGAQRLSGELGSLEAKEFTRLKSTFDAEVGNVARERGELGTAQGHVSALADQVTRQGLERVRSDFAESVLEADKGVVDVYWVKKVDVSDEYSALLKEQEALVRELNGRFRLIRAGLPDPTLNVPTDPTGAKQ